MWRSKGRAVAHATLAATLAFLAPARADDNFYFRFSPPQVAATASSPPLQSTDSTTGITVTVPCVVCRVRRNAVVGFQPTVTGAQGPVTWSLGSGAPPAGTVPSATTGAVSGTAGTPGTSTFTLLVTDERAKPASSPSVTFQVLADPAVSYASSSGPANRSVLIDPATSAVLGPATYALATGALPAGLSLDPASGRILGTAGATAVGLRVAVTDSDGATATSAPFDIVNVDQGSITFAEGTYRGRTGVPFSARPVLTGMRANASLNVSSGVIPAGLGVDPSTGEIYGIPSIGATSSGIVLSGPDAGGSTVSSAPISIVIVQPAIAYAPTTAYVGQPYSLSPTVAGLQGPTFSRLGGTFPPGLTLSPSTGAISGTPTAYGTQSGLQVTAIDGDQAQATSDVFAIRVMQSVSASVPALTLARVGTAMAMQATYENFSSTPSWALSAGTLPAGLTLDGSSGRVSGTPALAGESTDLVLTAADGGGASASTKPFAIRVVPPLGLSYPASTTLPRSRPASILPTTVGLVGRPTYILAAGGLPIGLSVDPDTGAVTGTPSQPGTSTGLRGLVQDNGTVASNDFAITVADQSASMADMRVRLGRFVTRSASSSLITSPTWTLTSGSLPAGVVAQSSGTVEGTPRVAGTFDGLLLTATGSDGSATTPVFRVQVIPTLTVTAPADVSGAAGNALAVAAPAVDGAFGNLTYVLLGGGADVSSTLGSTCPGLSFSRATGTISGVPSGACTATLSYSVSDDGAGDSAMAASAASSTFKLTVVQPTVTASSNVATIVEGDALALSATTSLPNPTWSVSGNPAWMTFSVTGDTYATSSVSGDVATSTTYALTLRASSGTATAERAVTVTVNPAAATLADAAVRSGGTFSAAVTETMPAPGAWSASADPSDVSGIAVSGGNLTGTAPVVTGTAPVTRTLSATHAATVAPSAGTRASASASSTLTVHPGLSMAAPADRSGNVGMSIGFAAPVVTGRVGTLTYAMMQGTTDVSGTFGSVCAGLSFSTVTGAVSGTATGTCAPNLAYRVTDNGGGVAALAATATSTAFALTVTPALATASTTSATVTEGDLVSFSATTNLPNPTWTATGNPPWMSFSASGADFATSSVSADVATVTTHTVTLTATSGSSTAQQVVTVTVNPASATLDSAAVRSGGSFSAAIGRTMPATGTWSASASPADVTGLTASGSALTGTAPANAGTTAVTRTLTATYAATQAPSAGARASASASSTLTVHPGLSIADQAPRSGSVGNPLPFAAPAVTGRVGTLAYAMLQGSTDVSGSLGSVCPGLSFATATGAVSGTPTATCSANLSYRVTDDGAGVPALVATASSPAFALAVTAATVTASTNATTLTEGDVASFSASTSLPGPSWTASGNPAWMVFTATAGTYSTSSVSADVATTTTYPVTLTATSGSSSAQQVVSVTVNPVVATLSAPAPVRSGRAFSASVSETMAAAGTWSASASPADVTGLGISGSILSGTAPANAGASALTRTLVATHSATTAPSAGTRAAASASASLTVHPDLAVAAPANRSGQAGTSMSFAAPGVDGRVGTLTYVLLQGSSDVSSTLGTTCPGLGFSTASGTVTGTPSASCSATLAYRVSDDGEPYPATLAATATSTTFTLGVSPATATASTSTVSVVEGSPATFSATTSLPSPTWSASGNPAWMRFTQSGTTYGTTSVSPDVASVQTYPVVLTATDASGATTTTNVSVQVSPASASVAGATTRSGGTFTMALSDTMAAAAAWTAPATQVDVTGIAVSGSTLAGIAPSHAGPSPTTRTVTASHTATTPPSSGAAATSSGSGTLTLHPALAIASGTDRSGIVGSGLTFGAPSVTGQVGTLTYALLQGGTDVSSTLGTVCPGLSFAPATGTVSGNPTATCSPGLTYRVTDDGANNPTLAAAATSPAPFALRIGAATVTASTTALTVAEGDTVGFSATTNLPSPTWTVSGNPSWMAFTSSAGTYATSSVSADVTTTQTYTVNLTATSGGSSAQQAVTVTVTPSTVTLATPAPVRSGGAFAAAVARSMVAAGAWTTSASPADVANLAVSGSNLTGTAPTNAGPSTIARTLTASYTATAAPTTGARATATASSTLSVYPGLAIAAPANQGGTAGNAISFAPPSVTGQVGALTWTLLQGATDVSTTLGSTCPGLAFSKSTGAVSGNASSTCSATLAYRVADDGGANASLAASATSSTFALAVTPAVASASATSLTVTEGDAVNLSATTSLSNPTWSATGNPAWMAFSSTGGNYATSSVSADVATTQTYTVNLTATNASGATSTTTVTVQVTPSAVTVAGVAARSGGAFSTAVSESMVASGAWAASATPPDVAGLAVSGTSLSGTAPANAGTGPVTRTLGATYTAATAPSSGPAATASGSGTLTVYPALTVGTPANQSGTAGTNVAISAPPVGGQVGALTYALLNGASDVSATLPTLCPGLSFSVGTGSISGNPTAACSASLTYAVTDGGGATGLPSATARSASAFTLTVTGATVTASTTALTVTEGDAVAFSATTSLQSPTWSVSGNPAWMTLTNTAGTYATNGVSGDVPSGSATVYAVVLKATSGSIQATQTVNVTVNPASVTVDPIPAVRGGRAFSTTVSETMAAPGTWSASASPADVTGLAVSGTTLSGTAPANTGNGAITRSLTVAYTGPAVSAGPAASASATPVLTVNPNPVVTPMASVAGATYTDMNVTPASAQFVIGTASWSTTSTLPAGVTLSATGQLTGKPTQSGSYPITLTVTDSYDGATGNGSTTLVVSSTTEEIVFETPNTTNNTVDFGTTTNGTGGSIPRIYIWNKGTQTAQISFSTYGDSPGTDDFTNFYAPGASNQGPFVSGHEYTSTITSYSGDTTRTAAQECKANLAPNMHCWLYVLFSSQSNGPKTGYMTVKTQKTTNTINLKGVATQIISAGYAVFDKAGTYKLSMTYPRQISLRFLSVGPGNVGYNGLGYAGNSGKIVRGDYVTDATGNINVVVGKAPTTSQTQASPNTAYASYTYGSVTNNSAMYAYSGDTNYGLAGSGGFASSTSPGIYNGAQGGDAKGGFGTAANGKGAYSNGKGYPSFDPVVIGQPYAQYSYTQTGFRFATVTYADGGLGANGSSTGCGTNNGITGGQGGGGGVNISVGMNGSMTPVAVPVPAKPGVAGTLNRPGQGGGGFGGGGGGGEYGTGTCNSNKGVGGLGADGLVYVEWDTQ